MNLNGIFNLKLLGDDFYQLWNENIEKACLIVEKSNLKVNRLFNSTNFEYFRKIK